jgi:hypothetical protein
MHLTSTFTAALALLSSEALGLTFDKRYNKAPFKPTACVTDTIPTDTMACNIEGFHKTTGHITLTTAKVTTTWAKPAATAAFQVVLKNSIEVRPEDGIEVYDVDLDSSPATFKTLQDAKKYVVCYFSAGTSEVYRKDVGCFNHEMGAQDYGRGHSQPFAAICSTNVSQRLQLWWRISRRVLAQYYES